MTIDLKKGQRISLKKEAPELTKVMCGLGWDVGKASGGLLGMFGGGANFDLDSSLLCLDANNRLKNNNDVIYFGNLSHRSGSITHLGDNLTGQGTGDDEQIIVDLSKIPTEIVKLVFTVNIYKCLERKQDFSQINNAFVRLVDSANNKEIARYNLSGREYQGSTGMIMAEIDREGDEWKMIAIGEGIRVSGLQELINSYQRSS
jgi:tellurium resistance protein TerD